MRAMSSDYVTRRKQWLQGAIGKPFAPMTPIRSKGFPADMPPPIFRFNTDEELKAHPQYSEAKAGSPEAAIRLVADLAMPLIERVTETLPDDSVFVAPHAIEATGDNAIPQVLAAALAVYAKGSVDGGIVQAVKVFHTGADPMERLNLRPFFDGPVAPGGKYVLVDDVSTMGGTLAELANYIQLRGGHVAGVVVIVNASRSGTLFPAKKTIRLLVGRFGDEIREIFGIEPDALTADEANYLIGFRSADEIRNRSAKAREETHLRLRSKGVFEAQDEEARVSTAQRRRIMLNRSRAKQRSPKTP